MRYKYEVLRIGIGRINCSSNRLIMASKFRPTCFFIVFIVLCNVVLTSVRHPC